MRCRGLCPRKPLPAERARGRGVFHGIVVPSAHVGAAGAARPHGRSWMGCGCFFCCLVGGSFGRPRRRARPWFVWLSFGAGCLVALGLSGVVSLLPCRVWFLFRPSLCGGLFGFIFVTPFVVKICLYVDFICIFVIIFVPLYYNLKVIWYG